MELNEKLVKEISAIAVIILFGILVFFTIKPIFFAILWGLILAYVFMPVYTWINKYLGNKIISAVLTLLLGIAIVLIPFWFLAPLMAQQIFELFRFSQTLDLSGFFHSIFPTASSQFTSQLTTASAAIIGQTSSYLLNSLTNVFINLPEFLIDLFVISFVFFFTLKDSDKLIEFVSAISPISPAKGKLLIKQFKEITYSIIYGIFIIGLLQGIVAGIGYFIFGIENALILTVLSIIFSILPFAGAYFVWIPVAVYIFAAGNILTGVLFVLFNLIFVAGADNVLRAYIISKQTNLSPVFALISMIGGLFLFGATGIILGPLIFAYFIILLDMYREKNLLDLFFRDEDGKEAK